jgi:hypothetical protein
VPVILQLQLTCAVPVDEPIFQPFPPEVTYHAYAPFKEYKALLYLRNNDTVGPASMFKAQATSTVWESSDGRQRMKVHGCCEAVTDTGLALFACPQVPRRVKILPPDSRFFSVHRVLHEGQEDGSSVASGMEVAYEGAGWTR